MTKLEELKLAADKANKVWDKAYDAWINANDALGKANDARAKAGNAYRDEQDRLKQRGLNDE